jgi:mRNA interferase MazF
VVIEQGEIYWADFGQPAGSEPGYVRPFVIVQDDSFNRSRISTVVGVPVSSRLSLLQSPGNVALSTRETGLDRDSVANISQISTLDRRALGERIGKVNERKLEQILDGIQLLIGR